MNSDFRSADEDRICGGGVRGAGREPFALPGTPPAWPPDRRFEVVHMVIDVAPDFATRSIRGEVELTLRPLGSPLHRVELDAVEMTIEQVGEPEGKTLPYSHADGRLAIRLPSPRPPGTDVRIRVRYACTPRRGLWFVGPDADHPDKPLQLWTQGQDEDSRCWFPCRDYPDTRATTEVIVTAPEGFLAVSNGVLVSREPRANGVRWHFRQDVPHVSYLVSLVVGRFDVVEDQCDGIPLRYIVPPGKADLARRVFADTPRMMRCFARAFGQPYPFPKYDQVAVADFTFGGMENTSATTLTDRALLDERALLDADSDALISHELAHQWWGDLVTCRDWSHGWLNEGFATFSELLWTAEKKGPEEAALALLAMVRDYFEEDDRAWRRPIVTQRYAEPIDLFDRHLYEKGGIVLHMLRRLLGEDAFHHALAAYGRVHARGSVETSDFRRVVEDVTGRRLGWFFEEWIDRAGFPEVRVAWRFDETAERTTVAVTQTQDTSGDTPLFRMPLTLRFGLPGGFRDVEVEMREAAEEFVIPLPERPRWVRFDSGFRVLHRMDFPRGEDALIAEIRENPDILDRIEAVSALGTAGGPGAIRALRRLLETEGFHGLRSEAARALATTGSDEALEVLRRALAIEDPKVRRGVARALGAFRRPEAAESLAALLRRGDPSVWVEGDAATALGRTRQASAFDLLVEILRTRPSCNDWVRRRAAAGLAALGDIRAIEILTAETSPRIPELVRVEAILAVGRLGARLERTHDVREVVESLLLDGELRVRRAAAAALEDLGDAAAVPALDAAADRTFDGRLRRMARRAARALRAGRTRTAELRRLRDDLDEAVAEARKLRDRVARLETFLPGDRAAKAPRKSDRGTRGSVRSPVGRGADRDRRRAGPTPRKGSRGARSGKPRRR